MKRLNFVAIGVAIVVFLFMACAQRAPLPAREEPGSIPIKEAGKEAAGWAERWERTLQAAKKEGSVVVYGGSAAAALKTHATKIIKEKFGLNLEVVSGRGGEIISRIRTERANGLFIPGIYASGVTNLYDTLKPLGAVDPMEPALMLPEVLDLKLWFDGKLPWGDEDRKALIWAGYPNPQIAINTTLVRAGEIKSYQDLLDPKWKGKIVANDPTEGSGSAYTGFNALLYNKIVDLDFFRRLVERQQLTMLRDQHLQINWLVRGRFPIALWPSTGRMAEYKEAGAPIEWLITREGVHLAGGGAAFGLMNRAPHPNAAAILLNWLLSREGQLLLQNSVDKQSLRLDLPSTDVDPAKTRQPGIKYFPDPNNIEEWVMKEAVEYLQMARETFSPLLR